MIFLTDDLQFQSPEGFTDGTQYLFESKVPRVRLSIDFGSFETDQTLRERGKVPSNAEQINDLISQQRKELELGVDAKIEREVDQPVAGRLGRRIDYLFGKDSSVLGRTVAVPLQQDLYAKVDYLAPVAQRFADRFEQVIESFSLGSQSGTPPVSGMVRRRARQIWIDMPEFLSPPRKFRLLSSDWKSRLNVTIIMGEAAATARGLQDQQREDADNAEAFEQQKEQTLPTALGMAKIVSYVVQISDLGKTAPQAICRAEVVETGRRVQIVARTPGNSSHEISQAVKELLRTLKQREAGR